MDDSKLTLQPYLVRRQCLSHDYGFHYVKTAVVFEGRSEMFQRGITHLNILLSPWVKKYCSTSHPDDTRGLKNDCVQEINGTPPADKDGTQETIRTLTPERYRAELENGNTKQTLNSWPMKIRFTWNKRNP